MNLSVLLVDDDEALRKQFIFALEKKYKIFEADRREEAFEIIDKHTLDVAIIDLGLPPYENSHREGRLIISKLLENSHTKIIVLTGQESKEYSTELISMGVFDYLLKPVSIPTLLSSIQRAAFFIENEKEKDVNTFELSFDVSLTDGLKGSSDEAQKQMLLKVLQQTNFNINQSAKLLGASRENIYYFLKKFHIQRPDA
jgi:DNA-binding NtrC family response regulator